jgi:hypothetical protein
MTHDARTVSETEPALARTARTIVTTVVDAVLERSTHDTETQQPRVPDWPGQRVPHQTGETTEGSLAGPAALALLATPRRLGGTRAPR